MIGLLSWAALSKRLLVSGSARHFPRLTKNWRRRIALDDFFPIRVIVYPDHETGNGSRVKHVEEQDHWPGPVDLSFRLQE